MSPTTATPLPPLAEIEAFLQGLVAQLEPEAPTTGPGRPRLLPALCLWTGLLVCVLRGFGSYLALWRLLTLHGLWRYPRIPLSDQAVYKRLAQAGPAPLEALFHQLNTLLTERLAPYASTDLAPFATEVVALDQTTLDHVARLLPPLRPLAKGDSRLLPGQFGAVFDLRRQGWRTLQYHPDPLQNEKKEATALLVGLPKGTLVLADLGYFSFPWFDHLTTEGYWWVSRLRKGASFTVQHTFYAQGSTRDALIWLGAYRADRTQYLVRLVEFAVGERLYQYITNVRDPRQLSPYAIAQLYARRWDIELGFRLLKQYLKVHLLWSAQPTLVLQQVWAGVIIAQVLQALRLEIAGRAGVDPYAVSMALLVEYLPQFAAQGVDPLEAFVTQGWQARFIRPSTRTRIVVPEMALEQYHWPTAELVLEREARYAGRTRPRVAERSQPTPRSAKPAKRATQPN